MACTKYFLVLVLLVLSWYRYSSMAAEQSWCAQ